MHGRAASTRAAVDYPSGDGQRSPPGAHRTNMRNPGSSPTTVMCPLQGEVSSNRNTLPGRSRLVSPSGGGDGKGPLQNDAELNCGSRMVEAFFEVLSTPARVKSSEECARGRKIASDVDWRRRRREVFLAKLRRHVLKVGISVGRAIKPCVGEMQRIAAVLGARCGGIPQPAYENENERERLGLPAHRVTLLGFGRRLHRTPQAFYISPLPLPASYFFVVTMLSPRGLRGRPV